MAGNFSDTYLQSMFGNAIGSGERDLDEAWDDNLSNDTRPSADYLRTILLNTSNLQLKSMIDSNIIKCKTDMCKNIIRNITP